MNFEYLPKVCIRHYYHSVIIILKNWRISAKMPKIEVLGNKQIAYMKLIKIQSCHMGVIFTPKNMTWQRQQCVHTYSQIMRYHTGNVYCNVVPNVQASIFLTRQQTIIIPAPVLQFVFTSFIWFDVVQNMAGFRWMTRHVVTSVNRILLQENQQNYALEKS